MQRNSILFIRSFDLYTVSSIYQKKIDLFLKKILKKEKLLLYHFFIRKNFINIADILSNPVSLLSQSYAKSSSKSSYKTFPNYFPAFNLSFIHLHIYILLFFSHIPSQPIIMKSIPSFLMAIMSGIGITSWSCIDKLLSFL